MCIKLRLALILSLIVVHPGGAAAVAGPFSGAPDSTRGDPPVELVVLVHGLGRTPISMMPLEWALEDAGYTVFNWGYSSVCCAVADLARELARDLATEVEPGTPAIHFVGHCLGGIIVRSMISRSPPSNLGRVVMLAPPNQGSAAADRFEPALGWLLKPLGDITTDEPDNPVFALDLPPSVEVGVIAGAHDGKVSVAESHLEGESDHVVVPSAHTFIMARDDVRQLVTRFLRTGDFDAPAVQP
jgi:pimeloyl-ACP methyl ester carboxylesterase